MQIAHDSGMHILLNNYSGNVNTINAKRVVIVFNKTRTAASSCYGGVRLFANSRCGTAIRKHCIFAMSCALLSIIWYMFATKGTKRMVSFMIHHFLEATLIIGRRIIPKKLLVEMDHYDGDVVAVMPSHARR